MNQKDIKKNMKRWMFVSKLKLIKSLSYIPLDIIFKTHSLFNNIRNNMHTTIK